MNIKQQFTEVEFGQQKIKVPKGGYYDRFRMNPDLDEVAQDPTAGNIDFFRHIPKKLVESRVGPVWAPNFYYRSANVQLLMLAPIKQIKAKLPDALTPLQPFPGYGLVAVTFSLIRFVTMTRITRCRLRLLYVNPRLVGLTSQS